MKKLLVSAFLLTACMTGVAHAESWEQHREARDIYRIHQGVMDGRLSPFEAHRLIRRDEHRYGYPVAWNRSQYGWNNRYRY